MNTLIHAHTHTHTHNILAPVCISVVIFLINNNNNSGKNKPMINKEIIFIYNDDVRDKNKRSMERELGRSRE